MNSWERMVTALELEEPDMVPVFEMHMPPAISRRILGRTPVFNNSPFCLELINKGVDVGRLNRRIAEETVECHIRAGLDYIRAPGGYSRDVKAQRLEEDLWVINGSRYRYSGGSFWFLDEPELYDPDEMLEWARQPPPEPREEMFETLRYIVKMVKGEIFISFDADGSWGPIVSRPRLLTHVLMWMRTRPDVVKAVINRHVRYAVEVGKAALDEGADAIMMCVDYGCANGPWMQPAMFREFVKPALRQQVEAFKRRGGFTILHSDGNIWAILDDVVDTGIDAYQGIDALAGMRLDYVKEKFGDRLCLIGNFNPRILEYGGAEDVFREVIRCFHQGAPGGGYVFSTSANASVNTNADNFLLMLGNVRKLRRYPYRHGFRLIAKKRL